MDSEAIDAAARALGAGRLVIVPTETVYGLAADAANPDAVARLYAAKGRPRFNPLIVHVLDAAAAKAVAILDRRAVELRRAFWPGPLTIVAPVARGSPVCDLARAGLDSVAVRVPAHPIARALLKAFAGPIVAPSANLSGRPSPTTLAHALTQTGAAAAVALDGGPCDFGVESTVVALLPGPARLLRPGAVARREIEALIGPLAAAEDDARRSPGLITRHYAPRAPLRLDAGAPLPGEAYLAFGPHPPGPAVFKLSPAGDVREAAANLFAMLIAADALEPTTIAVAPIPDTDLGEAINDRLRRAAAG